MNKKRSTPNGYFLRGTTTFLRLIALLFADTNNPALSIALLGKAKGLAPSEKNLYLDSIKVYEKRRNWDGVISVLKAWEQLNPDDMDMQQYAGTWMMRLGLFDEAFPYFESHLTGRKKENNNYKLANAFAQIGICCVNLERWEDAEKYLQQARERIAWDPDACCGTMDLFQYSGRFEEVKGFLENFIHDYPQLYPPYGWLATFIQYYLYKPADSLQWNDRALKLMENEELRDYCDRFMTTAHFFDPSVDDYIQALIDSGEKEQAFAFINKTRWNKIGDRKKFYGRLINYYFQIGEYQQSELLAKKVLMLKRQDPEIWTFLALAQIKQQKYEIATKSVERALTIDKDYFDAIDAYGIIQMGKNDWEAATITYQNLLKKRPFISEWLNNLGKCYTNTGQIEKAIERYKKVTIIDPLNAKANVELGILYHHVGKKDLAKSALQKGLSSDCPLDESKRKEAIKLMQELES